VSGATSSDDRQGSSRWRQGLSTLAEKLPLQGTQGWKESSLRLHPARPSLGRDARATRSGGASDASSVHTFSHHVVEADRRK
jgi:hypothetical protein